MSHIFPVEMLGFPSKYPAHVEVSVGREELILAAIATGKGGDLLGIGVPFAVGELVWKLGVIDGCIEFDRAGRLAIDSGVSHLDPSEKAALAFILSNAQTGLIANRVLGATHVLHLKALAASQYRRRAGAPKMPDFVAIDARNRNTFIIETKGTVGPKVDAAAERKALSQLGTRVTLNGYRNTVRYAHYSEFPRKAWRVRLQYESGRSATVPSSGGQLLWAYYAPLVDWLRQLPEHLDGKLDPQFRWARIERLGIAFGIWIPIVEAVESIARNIEAGPDRRQRSIQILGRRGSYDVLRGLEETAREALLFADRRVIEGLHQGPDGLAVQSTRR